jgi:uncharacterized membrane protein YjfL (UPF0719 family)
MVSIRRTLSACLVALLATTASGHSSAHSENEAVMSSNEAAVVPASLALGGELNGATLEYSVTMGDSRAGGKDTVTITYEVPSESWLAVGVSPTGLMTGSEVVLGLPDTGEVVRYRLNGYVQQASSIAPLPEAQQTLIDTSVVQNGDGKTSLTFTKIMDEGDDELKIGFGANTFVAAYGYRNFFSLHRARGSFNLDLEAGESAVLELRSRGLWKAHGWFATLAWGLCAPLAIGAALLRKWFPDGLWFKIHQCLNYAVLVFTMAAFFLAVGAYNMDGGEDHFNPNPFPHRLVGLIVFLLVVAQTIGGQCRPKTPEKGEEKSTLRGSWEIGHRFLGIGLLAMAWYQIQSGIEVYQQIFFDSADLNLVGIFWGILGTLLVLIVGAFAYIKLTGGDEEEEDKEGNVNLNQEKEVVEA